MARENAGVAWNAADYAKHSTAQQGWARELIAKLELTGDEALLDIGCGDGKVTAEIAKSLAGGSVVGVDSSRDMIDLARRQFPPAAHPNLTFAQQDARELSFDQEFDVVFSNATLHWVIDHRPVLAGIYDALRPGGRAYLQMGGKGNAAQEIAIVEAMMQQPEWREYFEGFTFPYGFYSPDEYAPWVRDAGLELLRIDLLPKDMAHKNLAAFKGWIRTTWLPYLERLPVDKRDRFIDEAAEGYMAKYPPNESGEVRIKMHRLELVARKPAAQPEQVS